MITLYASRTLKQSQCCYSSTQCFSLFRLDKLPRDVYRPLRHAYSILVYFMVKLSLNHCTSHAADQGVMIFLIHIAKLLKICLGPPLPDKLKYPTDPLPPPLKKKILDPHMNSLNTCRIDY